MAQSRQLGLFGNDPPSIDASFSRLERVALSDDAWFDYAPGWLAGHESLFTLLCQTVHWRREQRTMYERRVDVPRLVASLPDDGPIPPIVAEARAALSSRYGEPFPRVSLGYYRNGQESVAWHGDYVARHLPSAHVATISVGAPRRFLLRPKGGGRSLALRLGWGDLLVMGGSCQRTFEHSIPKVASAAPRIALMLRPVWQSPADP